MIILKVSGATPAKRTPGIMYPSKAAQDSMYRLQAEECQSFS